MSKPYEMTGYRRSGVVQVTHWRPATTAADKLREHLLMPGYGGTDYGLTDAELDRYLAAAEKRRGGMRLSVLVLAREAIERDQGIRPSLAEQRARFDRAMRDIAIREGSALIGAFENLGRAASRGVTQIMTLARLGPPPDPLYTKPPRDTRARLRWIVDCVRYPFDAL